MCSQNHLRDYNIFHGCAWTSHKKFFSNIAVTLAVLKFFLHFSSFASWLCHICFVCVLGTLPGRCLEVANIPSRWRAVLREDNQAHCTVKMLFCTILCYINLYSDSNRSILNWNKYSARSLQVIYTVLPAEILHSRIFCTNVEVEHIL